MRYALITDGTIVNVIIADADFASLIESEYDHVLPCDHAGPGWSYDGSEFHPPEEEVTE